MELFEGIQTLQGSLHRSDPCGQKKEDVSGLAPRNLSDIEDLVAQPGKGFGHQGNPSPEVWEEAFDLFRGFRVLRDDDAGHPVDLGDNLSPIRNIQIDI